MNDLYTFEIRVAQDEDVCIVTMATPGLDHINGSSKRHPKDTFHHTIGECVAFSRLFETLSDHYEEVVKALQTAQQTSPDQEQETEVDIAEAVWLQQFGVPSQEMGSLQIEQGDQIE